VNTVTIHENAFEFRLYSCFTLRYGSIAVIAYTQIKQRQKKTEWEKVLFHIKLFWCSRFYGLQSGLATTLKHCDVVAVGGVPGLSGLIKDTKGCYLFNCHA
jgi:hypothetical protein